MCEAEKDRYGLEGNVRLSEAIARVYRDASRETLLRMLAAVLERMDQGGQVLVPVELPQAAVELFLSKPLHPGDVVTAQEDLHFRWRKLRDSDGGEWLVAFTAQEEVQKGEATSVVTVPLEQVLRSAWNREQTAGVILNPWENSIRLNRQLLDGLMQVRDKEKEEAEQ